MSTLFPKSITIERETAGAYSATGVWVDGSITELTVTGSVHPMSARELEALEIGRKDIGKVKAFVNQSLIVSTEDGTAKGDIIQYDNKRYEVIMKDNFNNDLIPHYRYVAEYRSEVA